MKQRRNYLVTFMVVLFLVWNVVTYYFLTYNTQSPRKNNAGPDYDFIKDADRRLKYIAKEVKRQIETNEALLRDLLFHQQDKTVGSNDTGVVVGGASVVQSELSPETYEPPHFLAKVVIPVLVFACNRPTVKRNLDQLIKLRPSKEQFPIIVTQDCGHAETARVIKGYGDQLVHIQQPDLSNIELPYKERKFQGYYKIARHYKWALNQVFHKFNHDIVLIVEDDLDVSPDFFEYFLGLYPVLISDPTLWCVSAWNDNGKETRVGPEAERLYRSDFFPGLGWMMEKKTWTELEPKWPKTFWDDWMRQPAQRQNRSCIRPEICRTKTFGKKGVSNGLYYEQHLKFIKLNDKFVPFTKQDLSNLKKDRYDELFVKEVYGCPLLTVDQVKKNHKPEAKQVRVEYTTKKAFESAAKALGIMADLKSGVPRAGYRGVVSFYFNGRRVFLSPPGDWTKYDPTWN